MKRYFISENKYIMVKGHTYYVVDNNSNESVEVNSFEESNDDYDNFITLVNGEFISVDKRVPLDWISDVFIFKHLDDAYELSAHLRLSVANEFNCSATITSDRLKKMVKDRRYLGEIGIKHMVNYYDDADALVTEVNGYRIHHTRHNRRFPKPASNKYPDDNIRSVFIYRDDVYVCTSDRNANGILRLDEDGTLYLARFGELEEEIYKF